MSVDLVIANGTVITAGGRTNSDVLVSEGKVVEVRPSGSEVEAAHTIDATGRLVMPGMVDVHVHTREPGYEHKEDITTCTQAAAAGGVTTIFGMPNLNPPTVTRKDLDDVLAAYGSKSLVDFNHNPVPAVGEVDAMAEAGIAAFKVYMVVDTGRTYPHPAGTGIHDHGHLLQMFEDVARTDRVFMVHPHDQAIMDLIEQRYWADDDRSPEAYAKTLAAYDGLIWDTATATLLRLAEATGCRLHIVHVQTSRGIEMIRQAKARGVRVTAEVNQWALFLASWEDVLRLGPYCLSYWVPDHHKEAIWEGIADGTIDIMSSDHAPHTREEKEVGWEDMWSAHSGVPGVQFQLPLVLDAANEGKLTHERAVELTATAPARAFGLAHKGRIETGCDADIVVIDPNKEWTISNDDVLSRVGWTPYDGRTLTAQVERTFVRGIEVFSEGRVTGEPGHGLQARPI